MVWGATAVAATPSPGKLALVLDVGVRVNGKVVGRGWRVRLQDLFGRAEEDSCSWHRRGSWSGGGGLAVGWRAGSGWGDGRRVVLGHKGGDLGTAHGSEIRLFIE